MGLVSAWPVTVGEVGQARPNLPQTVIYRVCDELNASPLQLLTRDRRSPLPMARQLVAWLLQREGWTGPQIADLLGLEPSTVYYYWRNIDRRRRMEYDMAARCARLLNA